MKGSGGKKERKEGVGGKKCVFNSSTISGRKLLRSGLSVFLYNKMRLADTIN